MLTKVISGGQTGADQAGLRVARRFGIHTGGWMPKGWKTSRGPDPEIGRLFGLREHPGDYADRTETNVRISCGTLRFAADFNAPGEKCTLKWIEKHHKPFLDIDMRSPPAVSEVADWLRQNRIQVLNVAGNVEPKSPTGKAHGISAFVEAYLAELFRALGHEEQAAPDGDDAGNRP
jgi:hypothetical protein